MLLDFGEKVERFVERLKDKPIPTLIYLAIAIILIIVVSHLLVRNNEGDRIIVVHGDYVEGDKIINPNNPGFTEEERQIAKEYYIKAEEDKKAFQPDLKKEFPKGHIVFGAAQVGNKKGFIVYQGSIPEGLDINIDWNTGGVTEVAPSYVKFTLPNIKFKSLSGSTVNLSNLNWILDKKVGVKRRNDYSINGVRPVIEILGVYKDMVTIGMGFEFKKKSSS